MVALGVARPNITGLFVQLSAQFGQRFWVLAYLDDAKLAIRTPEDNRVLSQLESLLQLRSRSTDVDWLLSQ